MIINITTLIQQEERKEKKEKSCEKVVNQVAKLL